MVQCVWKWFQTISHTRKHTKRYATWCCTVISYLFAILPPFSSDQVWSLLKGGKICKSSIILVQHREAYHLVCFHVWEIVWNHFQTHRSTDYKVIRVISLITGDSLIKWGKYGHNTFFVQQDKVWSIFYAKKINCGTKLTYVPVSSLFTERITSN